MTQFRNPLAPSQVPNTQGRPAASSQHQPQQYAQPQQSQPQPSQHGDILDHLFGGQQGANRGQRPATQGYPETGYGEPQQAQPHRDTYAALRPDGYGYAQPAQQQPASDPFGLAGYTAPQPAPTFGTRAPQGQQHAAPPAQQGYDGYAGDPFAGSFGAAGQPGGGYGQPAHQTSHQAPQSPGFGAAPNNGYAAQAAPAYGQGYQPAQSPQNQWGGQQGFNLDPNDYNRGYAEQGHDAQGQWNGQGYGDAHLDPALGNGAYAGAQQGQQVSFDQSYAEDDVHYEEAPRGRSWKKIAAVMACTVFVGVGIASAYGSLFGPSSDEPTPVVKGAANPTKVKPSEPGGKQFAHTDSKIMGRLGEGETASADPAGVKRVPIVTVGRDGQIQAPSSGDETRAVVAVPGLTVIDGLNNGGGPSPNRPVAPTQQAAPVEMVKAAETKPSATPAVKKPSPVLNANADANDGPAALQTKQATVLNTPKAEVKAEPKAEPKKQRVAALSDDSVPAAGPKPTGAGYVAVLASVPASGSSRIDALKQFADMQQKYGGILQNKTPDIQEANLGTKGTYHRLMVGPPGSRDSATSVCTQLKAEGYSGCWVTAY